jgi:poly(3-hydroxybutyrate) depolymerase
VTSISLHDSVLAATHVARRSYGSWLTAWRQSTEAGLRYWAGAVACGATPLQVVGDGVRWLELLSSRRAPTWSTANEIVDTSPLGNLRRFGAGGRRRARSAPLLILPPQAGHHSCIVDYSAEQSQVRTALEAGHREVHVVEWLGATQETKDASISDYLELVAAAAERLGRPVHLVGDCQGGWLATIFAALRPDSVATLTVAGAPIDAHAGDSAIADYVHLGGGMTPYRLAVELGGGMLPGSFMLGGFVTLQPETELATHLELALHLDDEAYVARYADFRDWYDTTQPIPGAMYLWAVEHLFLGNELVRGAMQIDGRPVRLAAIDCPVTLLAGEKDHITPPEQVFALGKHVGTDPHRVEERLVGGGHLGLFMGHEALSTAWRPHFVRLASVTPA